MYRRKPIQTAVLNCKVPSKTRETIEKFAYERDLSLAEAVRHFLDIGLKHQEATA
jgi:hypothetical protein